MMELCRPAAGITQRGAHANTARTGVRGTIREDEAMRHRGLREAMKPGDIRPSLRGAAKFHGLPGRALSKLRSTNPLERVNREIGRRSDVVGIYPNDAALIRLAGALLIEQNGRNAPCSAARGSPGPWRWPPSSPRGRRRRKAVRQPGHASAGSAGTLSRRPRSRPRRRLSR